MATEPPFRPGDVVRTRWFQYEATVDRVVVRVYPFACKTGWKVEVERPAPCRECNRPHNAVPVLDSSWFWLQRRNPDAPIHVEQPAHRTTPIGGDDDGN